MHKQINQLRADLMAHFPERKDVIDGSLAAVLAGEHVLLIGPPGTAKSALVRCIAQLFGGSYFERLLTKFSTPEELFGPISLQGLAQDRFVRLTAGKLPEAEFAFVDKIFKSNSAVLNALLSIINERVFHNDGAPVRCPLVSLFAASNELPEGKELEALFDRFLLRFDVGYLLVASDLRGVLVGPEPAIAATLTMDELRRAQGEVTAVKVTDDTVDALLAIRDACRGEGITASDRRWKKALGIVRASATQIVHTHLIPFFGDMRLDEIRQSDVDAFARIELRRCARKTVNNRLAVLSTLLKYAHENLVIGKPTLRCHVGGSKAEDAPIVAVSAEDVERLVAAADAAYKVVVLLAVEAGLRVGELRGAQWTDIGGGEITIRRAIDVDGNVGPPKHNKVRRVPLSPRIVAALAALPKRGLWVLSSDDGSFLVYRTMLKAIQRLYKRAGVVVPRSETGKTMPFHSLRHSFGTECARRGVPVMTLRDLMGHADASTTQRYVTVTSADKHNAIERAFGQQVGNMLPKKAEDPQILVEKL